MRAALIAHNPTGCGPSAGLHTMPNTAYSNVHASPSRLYFPLNYFAKGGLCSQLRGQLE